MSNQQHKGPMINPKGKRFWEFVKDKYPYQVFVPYMSAQDLDPRAVSKLLTNDYIRVTFDNLSHYGFTKAEHLARYKAMAGIRDTGEVA